METLTIYDRYGGFETISAIVHDFYSKINKTPALDKYFLDVDMPTLIDHQTKFLCMALGGPERYEGRQLAVSHRDLGISEQDFVCVRNILKDVLEEFKVKLEDINLILDKVDSFKGDIVTIA